MRGDAPERACTRPGAFRADGATDMLESMMAENRTNRTWLRRSALALAAATLATVILAPTHAQQGGAIAGRVIDSSGEPLPGVTVAADVSGVAEPEPRLAVTDGQGRYRIAGLRAGTYTVTFRLPGFGTAVHQGVEVRGSSTRAVDVELAPGAMLFVPVPGADADTRVITIEPSQMTVDMGFGHALECEFPPSGAIEDCRPVIVAAKIFR